MALILSRGLQAGMLHCSSDAYRAEVVEGYHCAVHETLHTFLRIAASAQRRIREGGDGSVFKRDDGDKVISRRVVARARRNALSVHLRQPRPNQRGEHAGVDML